MWSVVSYKKSQEKPSILITVDTEKNLIRYEVETPNSLLNDQTAAKTSIDFLVKYTAQLKIQQIKRRLQIAAVDLDMLGKLNNMGPLLQWENYMIPPHLLRHHCSAVGNEATQVLLFFRVKPNISQSCDHFHTQALMLTGTCDKTTRWISAVKAWNQRWYATNNINNADLWINTAKIITQTIQITFLC